VAWLRDARSVKGGPDMQRITQTIIRLAAAVGASGLLLAITIA
jgi:hypothetical protein